MNKLRLLSFLLLSAFLSHGQSIYVEEGASLKIKGNVQLKVDQLDIVNNGVFEQQDGLTTWSKAKGGSFSGLNKLQFDSLIVRTKQDLSLFTDLVVNGVLMLNEGNLNLLDNNLLLPLNESMLEHETTTNRVRSSTGFGEIIKITTKNNLSNENVGNLGIVFTEFANEDSLIIRRGHRSVPIPLGHSISRYYQVSTEKKPEDKINVALEYFEDEIELFNQNLKENIWVQTGGEWNNINTESHEGDFSGELVATGELEIFESLITIGLYEEVVDKSLIPTVFTPNQDGFNDKFIIPNIDFSGAPEVSIYDRFGKLVYRSANYAKKPWDGTYQHQPLPMGTYFYRIVETNGLKGQIEGEITIVR